ncbi:ZN273 protein, partial [Poecile atricapillus]|nr:ZN273 protein [Poecile atricapillus]
QMETREDKSLQQNLVEEAILSGSKGQESNGEEMPKGSSTGKGFKPIPGCSEEKRPPLCFIQRSNLVVHEQLHAGEKPYWWTDIELEEKLHKCLECGKGFSQSSNLIWNQVTHSVGKSFACGECGMNLRNIPTLSEHQVIHAGERPYICLECQKRSGWTSALRKHQHIHNGERPHECPECGKSFVRCSSSTPHRRIHVG